MSVEQTLEDFQMKLVRKSQREISDTRKQEFRPSALPLCPLAWTVNELVYDGLMEQEENLGLDYFAGVGTVTHTSFQKWSGYHGSLFGDWEVKKHIEKVIDGKKWHRVITKVLKDTVGPVYHDGKDFVKPSKTLKTRDLKLAEYREIEVYDPDLGIPGHVDALIPYKDGYILLDYKTSSTKKLKDMTEAPFNYHNQIMYYWYLLTKYGPADLKYDPKVRNKVLKHSFRGKIKIYGSCIYLFPRDNPFDIENSRMFVMTDLDMDCVEANQDNYRRALKAVKTKKFKAVVENRLCGTTEEATNSGCSLCILGCGLTSEKVLKNVRELVES